VHQGLARHLAGTTSRFVLADCGSTDDTLTRVRDSLGQPEDIVNLRSAPTTTDLLNVPYHGIPGKARALHAILTSARSLGARACIVLDSASEAITPEWVAWLSAPVLAQGFDLVSPYYRRHPYEGALTKGVIYPMFRALYGVRLRQPAAAEFVCSARLLDRFL
jgi:glucosylglycerate synthase